MASLLNADTRARSGDWGRATMCIALCSCVQLDGTWSFSLCSRLHATLEGKRFWERSCSTLSDKVTASRSRSAEAIWKTCWQSVSNILAPWLHLPEQVQTRLSEQVLTICLSHLWEAVFPARLGSSDQVGMGMGMPQFGTFCFQAIVGITIDPACSTLTMSYLRTQHARHRHTCKPQAHVKQRQVERRVMVQQEHAGQNFLRVAFFLAQPASP